MGLLNDNQYYDVETGGFWLSSSYYEYLNPKSVNGLNMSTFLKFNLAILLYQRTFLYNKKTVKISCDYHNDF